jgi:hypothetical protein
MDAAAPRPSLADLGFLPCHAAAVSVVLRDPLERDTMIGFVARHLQPAPTGAGHWAQAIAVELAERRPWIAAETIALAAQGVVILSLAAELRGEPARLH